MMWEKIVRECLERQLKEAVIVEAALEVELKVQKLLVKEIKAELKKGEKGK